MELTSSSMKVTKLSSGSIDSNSESGTLSGHTGLKENLLNQGFSTYGNSSSRTGYAELNKHEKEERDSLFADQGDLWQDAGQDAHHQLSKTRGKWYSKAWHFFQTVLFLIVLGMLSSIAAQLVEAASSGLFGIRETLSGIPVAPQTNVTNPIPPHKVSGVQGFLFVIYNAFLVVFSLLFTNAVSPEARGSGIPRMKGVLSGLHIHKFLSWRSLLAKIVGVITAFSSNISIGREGPFVHIAACIAQLMMRRSLFSRYSKISSRRIDMLTVACACGVAGASGAPFGGVIFAVEVVGTYFYVPNIPRMFMASVCGTFIVKMITLNTAEGKEGYVAIFKTDFDFEETQLSAQKVAASLALFVVLGMMCGALSGLFIRLISKMAKIRQQVLPNNKSQRYLVYSVSAAAAVAILESCVVLLYYPTLPVVKSQKAFVIGLFRDSNSQMLSDNIPFDLAVLFVLKFILTAFCLTLPLTAGLFVPTLLLGAIFGRFVGELFDVMGLMQAGWHAGEFAVVAAAAFAGGTTRAISTAAIVIEMTGQYHMLLPVSLGVLSAYFVANRFSKPVYDCLVTANAFPHLPKISYNLGREPAHVAGRPALPTEIIELHCTVGGLQEVLDANPYTALFPLVKDLETMVLVGEVQRSRVEKSLAHGPPPDGSVTFSVDLKRGTEYLVGADDEHGLRQRGGVRVMANAAPFSVSKFTPLSKINMLFQTLRLSQVYLVLEGKFVGRLSRDDLVYLAQEQSKHAKGVL